MEKQLKGIKRPGRRCPQKQYQPGEAEIPKDFLIIILSDARSLRIYKFSKWRKNKMAFFTTAVTGLKTVVTAIGAGVGVWGVINLLEGYGNDNPGAKSQGIKQLMSGGGIIIVAQTVIPQLSTLFS